MEQSKKLDIQYINLDLLKPNPWNSNVMSLENEAKLEESLRRNDNFKTLTVRVLDDGSYQILGGEHRAKVAKKIGIAELPSVILRDISDSKAKEISLIDNSRYGSDDNLLLAEILASLDDVDVISDIMPFSEIEIETLMSASKFDLDDLGTLDDLDEDDLNDTPAATKTHTVMRFKIALEDAAEIEELLKRSMKLNGYTESDSLTNAGDALVNLLLGRGIY